MNRNIAKQFTTTLSLLDVASDRTHKYKCFHGEDIQLTVNVVGENNRLIDLSNTSVKIYFTLDKNVNEPVYRQDTGIVVDNLGIITVMLEKSYIRIGNNTLKIVLYDEDQTVFLQPLIISCIDPLIGEVADLEIPDDIDVRDELYDIRRIIGDLQDFDDDLGSEIIDARNEYATVGERLDNFDSQLGNITTYTNAKAYAIYNEITINEAINTLIQNNIPCYVPNIDVDITETINLNKDNYTFKCDGHLKTDLNIPVVNIDCMYSYITINKISNTNSTRTGEGVRLSPNKFTMCAYNKIYINQIRGCDKAIYCYADGAKGIQYNNITFNIIEGNRCIEFLTGTTGNAWINENIFNGGQLCGDGIGVYTRRTSTTDDLFNGNKFLNCGFEGLNKICDVDWFKQGYFLNFRAEESLFGNTWITMTNSYANKFETSSKIPFSKIDIDTTNYSNEIISYLGFRNGSNKYMANKILFGRDYRIIDRCKTLSLLDFFNRDCEPDFIDNDYAYDKLVRVKVSDGKSVVFSFLEKYLSLSFRNFDFVLETQMAGGSTISINANGTTLKTLKNTGEEIIKEAYRIFVYTQDETKRKINIIKISSAYDEYTIS